MAFFSTYTDPPFSPSRRQPALIMVLLYARIFACPLTSLWPDEESFRPLVLGENITFPTTSASTPALQFTASAPSYPLAIKVLPSIIAFPPMRYMPSLQPLRITLLVIT